MKDTGAFSPGIDEKYQEVKKGFDVAANKMLDFFNSLPAFKAFPNDMLNGEGVMETITKLMNAGPFFHKAFEENGILYKKFEDLKQEIAKSG